jgi:hypothetical protein
MDSLNLQDLQDLQVKSTYIYTRKTEWTLPVKVVKVVNWGLIPNNSTK